MASGTAVQLNMTQNSIGYTHYRYAASLQEFGKPRELKHCGGWILVRPIPDTPYYDAMGCYPVFACRQWEKLHKDMECLDSDLVSIALVTDPFSGVTPDYLKKCFDLVKPFKTHYVADLKYPLESFIKRGHRYNARKTLKTMDVEVTREPQKYLDDWTRLYDVLMRRHNITGLHAFSRQCFEMQMTTPGMIMVIGRCAGEIVGATLVLMNDQVAYSQFAAFSNEGYAMRASYGIYWETLVYLQKQGIRYFDHGGSAGIDDNPQDGLAKFKKGWSNKEIPVYLCGSIIDKKKYDSLCKPINTLNSNYFPPYRVSDLRTGHIDPYHQGSDQGVRA